MSNRLRQCTSLLIHRLLSLIFGGRSSRSSLLLYPLRRFSSAAPPVARGGVLLRSPSTFPRLPLHRLLHRISGFACLFFAILPWLYLSVPTVCTTADVVTCLGHSGNRGIPGAVALSE